jgi:hypothetical protein
MLKHIRHHHDFMWGYAFELLIRLNRPVFRFLLVLSTTTIGIFAAIFFFIEAGNNPGISSYFDSVYFVVTTMTGVGFGDIAPITTGGRVLTIFMMFSGTALFVAYTAALSAAIIDIERQFLSNDQNNRE